jgi:transmembrane sensor
LIPIESRIRLRTSTNKDKVWTRINDSIQHPVHVLTPATIPLYRKLAALAAGLALVVTSGAVLWLQFYAKHTVKTAYGEVTIIKLPDNSKVTLNGNTTLQYENSWNSDAPREVWIEGEAYFDIAHINKDTTDIMPGDRFIVHSDDINIEVLGTTFDVKHRRNQTDVTLITGKVKVHVADKSSGGNQDIIMTPGDHVEYLSEKLVTKKKLQKLSQVTAWTQHEFIFANAHLKDIVKTLQDVHGYSVDVEDELKELKIEGEISVASVEELLSILSLTLDLEIEKDNKRIQISRNK